jgi:histidinol phosphatase-like enzyme (inositol monophosphatase family)
MASISPALAAEVSPRLSLARSAGIEAGRLTLRYFQTTSYQVERKADNSPVTIADRSAEELLRARIAVAFPHDGILGEELGEVQGTSGFRWILDPIDGTKSFIHGVPLYGTMVAVEHEDRAVVGFVFMPALDEGVFAGAGQGSWQFRGQAEPTPARVSSRSKLAECLLVTSAIDTFTERGAGAALDALCKAAWITRTWGDCYGYLLVATGRADVMIDPILNVWDAAAVQPIVEEAGGTFTDWQGTPTIHAGEAVATNGRVLDEVLAGVRRVARVERSQPA